MGMIALPETGRLKSHPTKTKRRGLYSLQPKIITDIMNISGERGLLGHLSAIAIFSPKPDIFSTFVQPQFNSPTWWDSFYLLYHCCDSFLGKPLTKQSFCCQVDVTFKYKNASFIVLDSPPFFSFLQGLAVEATFKNKDLGLALEEKWP